MALYLVTPLGKELWIPLAPVQFGLPPIYAAGLLLAVDTAVCLFFLLALPFEALLARVPWAGRALARLATRVRASRLARRSLAAALALALLVPIHSGGAIFGTLTGRALGLPPAATFAAVVGAVALRFGAVLLALHGYLAWAA